MENTLLRWLQSLIVSNTEIEEIGYVCETKKIWKIQDPHHLFIS